MNWNPLFYLTLTSIRYCLVQASAFRGSEISPSEKLNALDAHDICVSAKSTCSSHGANESHTLLPMGKSKKEATHMIRLSFSGLNTMNEAKQFIVF